MVLCPHANALAARLGSTVPGGLLADLARLGLEERRVRLSELQAALMMVALDATLGSEDLALPVPVQLRARPIMAAELESRG